MSVKKINKYLSEGGVAIIPGFQGLSSVGDITTIGRGGSDATAVAITSTRANVTSIDRILVTNSGFGYTEPPTITFSGGGGTGAAATCSINTTSKGVVRFTMTDNGVGFGTVPIVTVSNPAGGTALTSARTFVFFASFSKIDLFNSD